MSWKAFDLRKRSKEVGDWLGERFMILLKKNFRIATRVVWIFFQLRMTHFLPDSRQFLTFLPNNYIYFLNTKTHSKGIIQWNFLNLCKELLIISYSKRAYARAAASRSFTFTLRQLKFLDFLALYEIENVCTLFRDWLRRAWMFGERLQISCPDRKPSRGPFLERPETLRLT